MSDTPTIVEKVAELKTAICNLKDVLSSNGLIAEGAPLSDYALSIDANIESINYAECPDTLVWYKDNLYPKRLQLTGTIRFGDIQADATKIIIGTNITDIDSGALSGFNYLSSVIFPSTLTAFGNQVFRNDINLVSAYISNNVLSIGWGIFQGCSALNYVYIGNQVQKISNYTFGSCSSLSKIEFNDIGTTSQLTVIGQNAFNNCTALTSIVIPQNVSQIQTSAFYNCENLRYIVFNQLTKPTCETDAFTNVYPSCVGAVRNTEYGATGTQWNNIQIIQTIDES